MDRQRLHLVEAAQQSLEEVDRADNPVTDEIGYGSHEQLVRLAAAHMPTSIVGEVGAVTADSDAQPMDSKELTLEEEARVDRLAETRYFGNYGAACEHVLAERPSPKKAA